MSYVLEGDRKLLEFDTYEDYLDSIVTPQDIAYLGSTEVARTIASLGYRTTGETLSRDAFYKRRRAVSEFLFPTWRPTEPVSEGLDIDDPLLQQLAIRERANRLGLLSTIIYIRQNTKHGSEISGYIDYRKRLLKENWLPVFQNKRQISPRPSDLGFYHWKSGESSSNSSANYKVILDIQKGLMFQNQNDRKLVCVDPYLASPGTNTKRIPVTSPHYEQVVIYDHVVRRKC